MTKATIIAQKIAVPLFAVAVIRDNCSAQLAKLFRKKEKVEIVPIRISGTYEHPSFGLDLRDKKAQTVPEPSKNVPPPPQKNSW